MTQRFGSDVRLRTRSEFKAVETGGRRASGRYLTLVGRPNGRAQDRLGIIASRRVGGAVQRNRAKRRLRELFRQRALDASRLGWDLVVIARAEIVDAPAVVVRTDFVATLSKLRGTR